MQLNLFDNEDPSTIKDKVEEPNGLIYHSNLLSSEEQIEVLQIIDDQPWIVDLKRRVQHYGYRYNYKSRRVNYEMHIGGLPEFALRVGQKLLDANLVKKMPDQLIINEYEPGQGIAAHVDCEPCFENTIVTVSLGSVYDMDFICVADKQKVLSKSLELGSALVMKDEARHDWMHRINARKSDPCHRGNGKRIRGRRVSLTFRNVIISNS